MHPLLTDGAKPEAYSAAVWLAFLGAVPFVAYAGMLWISPVTLAMWGVSTPPEDGMLAYGAVILSFLGGLHWALAVVHPGLERRRFVYLQSVFPALMGWGGLLTPDWKLAIMGLLIGFGFMSVADFRLAEKGIWPAWFLRVRMRASVVVIASLLAALLRPGW